MNIFYTPDHKNNSLFLDEQESRHCVKVLRMKEGDELWVVDGVGGFYEARLVVADSKKCHLQVLRMHEEYNRLPYHLHIGIAPTKNIDRFEWFLEKATEIGISEISPLLCERSERKTVRMDRLEKILISAMKQSIKAYKPILNEPVYYNSWIQNIKEESRFIAHCSEGVRLNINKTDLSDNICIAIGPEGDFSDREVKSAIDQNFMELSLGESRLRTETAGVVTCSAVYFKKQQ